MPKCKSCQVQCWTPQPVVPQCTTLILIVERFSEYENDIFVFNAGAINAANVVVTVTVTNGTLYDPGKFVMTGNVGAWTIGNLNAGGGVVSIFDFRDTAPWSFTMTLTTSTPLCSNSVTAVTFSGPPPQPLEQLPEPSPLLLQAREEARLLRAAKN